MSPVRYMRLVQDSMCFDMVIGLIAGLPRARLESTPRRLVANARVVQRAPAARTGLQKQVEILLASDTVVVTTVAPATRLQQ